MVIGDDPFFDLRSDWFFVGAKNGDVEIVCNSHPRPRASPVPFICAGSARAKILLNGTAPRGIK
jgi:hypothetical protein